MKQLDLILYRLNEARDLLVSCHETEASLADDNIAEAIKLIEETFGGKEEIL